MCTLQMSGIANRLSEKVSVGLWKQLKEKFQALQDELSKWLQIREQLGVFITNIVSGINDAHNIWSRSTIE